MKFLLLIAAWCMCGLTFGQITSGKISTVLTERLADAPGQSQKIIVMLEAQADLNSLEAEFRRNKPSQKERIAQLIPLLQNTARESQANLLRFLTESRSLAKENIRSLWISNIISLEANETLIKEIAAREDVDMVMWNAPGQVEVHECETLDGATAITSPNGTEAGLRAINAEEMWALGYTGYGTIAFGADTGIEPFHPSYANRWMGLYKDASSTWYEYSNSNTIPYWCTDHGTHTVGTMLGLDRMNRDTIGVAMNAGWIGGPILCGGLGTDDNIGAFEWSLNPDGDINTVDDIPTVVNNSWWDPSQQGFECGGVYISALQACEMAGVAIIFSAGNAGPGVSTITSPKNINLTEINAFCVGNLNGNSNSLPISNSSSRGPSVCGGDSSLLIKPEVSAPGSSVRSCEPDRSYGLKSGTSMAAPHVSGAILLLKEAFPELMSEDLKLALYLSARDLGIPGEDNIFGMGIIDVKAAYDYLIEQGNTPTPPASTNLDLIGVDSDPQLEYCGNTAAVTFFVTNGGADEITTFDYTVSVERFNGVVVWNENFTWDGNLSKNNIESLEVELEGLTSGEYLVKFNSLLPNGLEDPRPLNNGMGKLIEITSPGSVLVEVNGFEDGMACEGATTTLTGSINTTSDYFFKWYSDFQTSDLLGTGKTYTYEMGSQPEEFFAEPFLLDMGGETIPSAGEYTTGEKLFFAVFNTTELTSVDVYAEEVGNRFLDIKTLDGAAVTTKPIFVTEPGKTTVSLNIILDPGNYAMNFFVTKPLLKKTGDVNYPYMVGSNIRIEGASDDSTYPYFFNWKLERPYNCSAQRIVVKPAGTLDMTLDFGITDQVHYVNDVIAVTNNSDGAERYDWLIDGALVFENEEEPSFTFAEPGEYQITMVATNVNGCQSSLSETININLISSLQFPIEQYQFEMFPNPSNGEVNVNIGIPDGEAARYYLMDNLGRRIDLPVSETKGSSQFSFNVENLPAGLYFFEVQISGKPAWVHKLLVN